MVEEWKQYQPYPSYWASNLGNVKRIYKKNSKQTCTKTDDHL